MLKKFLTLATTAATLALAACGDAPRVTVPYMEPSGTWQEMVAAASRGPVLAAVLNNPFEAPTQAVTEATLGHMEQAVTGYERLRFTTLPGNAGNPDYQVVVAFNVPRSFPGRRLCEGEAPPVEAGEALRVMAVFCEAGRGLLADVRGDVGRTGLNPGDRLFRDLMSQVAIALFQKEQG